MTTYRTLTGKMEYKCHDDAIYGREVDGKTAVPKSSWTLISADLKSYKVELHDKLQSKDTSVAEQFRVKCQLHCILKTRPSSWYVEPQSKKLTRRIEREYTFLEEVKEVEKAEYEQFLKEIGQPRLVMG